MSRNLHKLIPALALIACSAVLAKLWFALYSGALLPITNALARMI